MHVIRNSKRGGDILYAPFNSLFEMHSSMPIDTSKYMPLLSILYLRCRTRIAYTLSEKGASFLSILYLRCTGSMSELYAVRSSLSILYLRCNHVLHAG